MVMYKALMSKLLLLVMICLLLEPHLATEGIEPTELIAFQGRLLY